MIVCFGLKVFWVEQQFEKRRSKRDFALFKPLHQQQSARVRPFDFGKGNEFADPLYIQQWHLVMLFHQFVLLCPTSAIPYGVFFFLSFSFFFLFVFFLGGGGGIFSVF